MAEIFIGQYEGKSIISKAIMWMTWSRISHTSAFLPDLETVIESWSTSGVIKRQWQEGHKKGTTIYIFSVQCTDEQAEIFYSELEKRIGMKYDFRGILGFIARGRLHNPDKMFCSELVFKAARIAGIHLLERVEPYQVSPGLLHLSTSLQYRKTIIT